MKNMKKTVALIAALSLTTTYAFASTWTTDTGSVATTSTSTDLVLAKAPTVVETTADSIKLEWEKVENASGYVVKYGKKSVANATDKEATYELEEQATSTGISLKGLEANTNYYISVVVIDDKFMESTKYSDEISATTSSLNAASSTGSTTEKTSTDSTAMTATSKEVDNKNFKITFSKELANGKVDVKITKTKDNSDVPVQTVELDATDKKVLNVKLQTVLDPTSEYTVSLNNVTDASGNTLKEALTANLTTTATLASAPDAVTSTGALTSTATPETWAKEVFVLIAAILLGSVVVLYTNREKIFVRK